MAACGKEETVQKQLPGLLFHMKGLCVALHYVSLPPQKSHVLEQGFVLISVISGRRCSAPGSFIYPSYLLPAVNEGKNSYTHDCFKKVLFKSSMLCCHWWVCWELCFNHKRVQSFSFSFHGNLPGSHVFQCLLWKLLIISTDDEKTLTMKGHGSRYDCQKTEEWAATQTRILTFPRLLPWNRPVPAA